MVTIPDEYKNKIAKFAERLGKTTADLEAEFLVFREEVSKMTKTKSETKLLALTYQRWLGTLRRDTGTIFSPAPTYTGIVLGDAGVKDFVAIMKNKADFMYKNPQTRQKAIDEMFTTSDGTPLDKREKVNYGKDDNPNYLQPFPDKDQSLYRAIFLLGSKGGSITEDVSLIRLNVNGKEAENIDYEHGTVVQIRGNPRKRNAYGFIDLNAISEKPVTFTPVLGAEIPEDLTEPLSRSQWTPYTLKDIPIVHGMYKDDRSVPILIYASVGAIAEDVNEKTHNRTLWLDELDVDFKMPGVSAFIPGDVKLEFGLDSRVLFVGTTRTIGEGEDQRYIYEIWGYYAPSMYLIPPLS